MAKFLSGVAIGVILGIIITIIFIYLGGGGWLEYLGEELIELGERADRDISAIDKDRDKVSSPEEHIDTSQEGKNSKKEKNEKTK